MAKSKDQPKIKKILIVEDDIYTLELYERQLKRAGYDVYRATDGDEGFKITKDIKPDLILLDIMLPKVDGLEMLRNMQDDEEIKGVPVLVLTKLGYRSTIKECLALGAQEYLVKASYDPDKIADTVSKFFAKSASAA